MAGGIFGLFGGSGGDSLYNSGMMQGNVSQQIVRENPEIEAYRLGLLELSKKRGEKPVNLPQQQVAGMTSQQQQAMSMAQGGLGAYQPYMTNANTFTAQSAGNFNNVPQMAQNYAQQGLNTNNAYTSSGIQMSKDLANSALSQSGGMANQGINAVNSGVNQGLNAVNQNVGAGLQQGAMAGGNALGQVGGAVGAANQYAGQGLNLAYNPAAQAAQMGGIMGLQGAQSYNPNSASAYMDPYQQEVTARAINEMERGANQSRQALASKAVGSGAFGGSRDAIMRSELERGLQDVKTNRIMEDYSRNFQQAQQASINNFQNQQARMQNAGQMAMQGGQLQSNAGIAALGLGANTALQGGQMQGAMGMDYANLLQSGRLNAAQLQGNQYLNSAQLQGNQYLNSGNMLGQQGLNAANMLGNQHLQAGLQGGQLAMQGGQLTSGAQLDAARGLGTLAQQQGVLGGLAQAYGQADTSYLYNMGANLQKQNQAQLDATYNNQLAKAYEPFQRISWMSDIYSKTPSSQSSMTSQSSPEPSAMSQIVGAGIAGYGALQAFNKAGSTFGS